jgi:hypothetical protein
MKFPNQRNENEVPNLSGFFTLAQCQQHFRRSFRQQHFRQHHGYNFLLRRD